MHPKRFALVAGIVMLVMGALALIPNLSNDPNGILPVLKENTSYGLFLGLFPMNIFNKVALIVFGLAGIWAANVKNRNLPASIWYARIVFVVMGAAAILGLFPATNTLNGYWPLFGYTVLDHAVFAVLGGYFGFVLSRKAHEALMHSPAA